MTPDDLSPIEQVINELAEASEAYYAGEQSPLTDAEFDQKLRELERTDVSQLATDDPGLYQKYLARINQVGVAPSGKFTVIKHHSAMLSLSNVFDDEELEDFVKRAIREINDPSLTFSVEPKFDGLALSIRYVDGQFKHACTRGDGIEGEDVSRNALSISKVPLKLEGNFPGILEVRGEVVITKDTLRQLNEQLEAKGQKTLANPRNAAAGTMRLHNTLEVVNRPLSFFAYDVVGAGTETLGGVERLNLLAKQGFDVSSVFYPQLTVENVVQVVHELEKIRPNLGYEIDGAVIKVNAAAHRDKLGLVSRSPRWATAYKYPPEEARSKVENIEVQVGRTGQITPVAKITPVQVGGVVVSSVTLHNQDQINRLDLRIGDSVLVRRAGDVVPEIMHVFTDQRDEALKAAPVFQLPGTCPSCNHLLMRLNGAVALTCTQGWKCPDQFKRAMEYFVSRDGFDIEGISTQWIDVLVGSGVIKAPQDFFAVTRPVLKLISGLQEDSKQIDNILASIEKARTIKFSKFLTAMGIPGIGIGTARHLARVFGTLEWFQAAPRGAFALIPNIGPITADSISQWLNTEENQGTLKELIEQYVTVTEQTSPSHLWRDILEQYRETKTPDPDTLGFLTRIASDAAILDLGTRPLAGQTFVLTGSFDGYSRDEAKAALEALGARVSGSVTSNTTKLFAGQGGGGKRTQAAKLGIPIGDEIELTKLLNSNKV